MNAHADRAVASVTLPWGEGGRLPLNLPPEWSAADVDVVWPDLDGAFDDYPAALRAALDASEANGPTLDALVAPGSKVAIIVDDPSRWTPVSTALPVLIDRLLGAGVHKPDVSISIGVGRHHALDDAAMRRRVGDAIVDEFRCSSPPLDDVSQYVDLGTTPEGVPVRVFRPVAEADLRILVGSVLAHLQAGFGGGYKLIFPGTSHRSTLGALHRQGLGSGRGNPAQLLGGDARANPMRRGIRAAAGLLGPCLSVSHLIGAQGQILRVRTGHPDPVQDALADEARRRFQAPPAPAADILIAGNHPWPGDPMQSFKVLLQHRAACRKGGLLVGLFWTDPGEIDRTFPMAAMRALAASGRLGGWAARHSLGLAEATMAARGNPSTFMVRWARELVVDRAVLVYAPPLFARLGPRLGPVQLFADQAELWRTANRLLRRDGITSPRVRIFPQGGLTYATA